MACRRACAGIWMKTQPVDTGSCSSIGAEVMLKILAFDTGGYWIWSKRLERGQFATFAHSPEAQTRFESH